MSVIRFDNVSKSYEAGKPVIKNLSLDIDEGEFVAFLGPSGCGKTTLLKLINRLIEPDGGKIYVEDKEIGSWNPIELRRRIGYVIQQIGLFPHMTVRDNICYVLNISRCEKSFCEKRALELIRLVGMEGSFLDRYPRELSGGQKQRIGVARALAGDPGIILMDEPLGAVDEISRRVLQDELLEIYNKLHKTIIFVTHDISEAIKLGTRIVLIDEGEVVQTGTREEMLFYPRNSFVENFFGLKNFTAYLDLKLLGEALIPVDEWRGAGRSMNGLPMLMETDSIMTAVKAMFDNGADAVGIENSEGVASGVFSFESALERLDAGGSNI